MTGSPITVGTKMIGRELPDEKDNYFIRLYDGLCAFISAGTPAEDKPVFSDPQFLR
jgi:hypothetical protein